MEAAAVPGDRGAFHQPHSPFGQGVDTPTKTALVLMHIVAGVTILAVFGRLGGARQ